MLRLIYFVIFLIVCVVLSLGKQPKSMHCNAAGAIPVTIVEEERNEIVANN